MKYRYIIIPLASILLVYLGLTIPDPPLYSGMVFWVGLVRVLSLIGGVLTIIVFSAYVVSRRYEGAYPFLMKRFIDLEYSRRKHYIERDARGVVLDLETGFGFSAIAAAKKAEVAKVVAIDARKEALEIAKENALSAKVSDKIEFRKGDLFQVVDQNESFDYIILNPPYIASRTNKVVEQFLKNAKNHLNPEGTILALVPRFDKRIISKFEKDFEMKVLEKNNLIIELWMYLSLKIKQPIYEEKIIPPQAKTESQPSETISSSTEHELLQPHVEKGAHGAVLDMQTGKGTLAIAAAQRPEVTSVVAVDANPKVVEEARENAVSAGVSEKIVFQTSDLFQNVVGEFDYIVFNPPPLRLGLSSIGWTILEPEWTTFLRYRDEMIRRFLREAKTHLSPKGEILLVLHLSIGITLDKGVTPEEIERDYEVEVLEREDSWFETFLCLSIKPRASTMP